MGSSRIKDGNVDVFNMRVMSVFSNIAESIFDDNFR